MQSMMSVRSMLVMTAFLLLGGLCGRGMAQDAVSSQVETQLETIYKISRVESIGNNITQLGTVVTNTKNNLLYQTPVSQLILCAATVKETSDQVASSLCRLTTKSTGGFLPPGTRMIVTKIKVNAQKDTVTFELDDAAIDPATNLPGHPTFKTAVNFVFAKGYLTKADAGQLADFIGKLLPIDDGSAAQQQPPPQQQVAQAPPPPPPPPPPAPTSVELGMTEAQVKSIMGQPTSQKQTPSKTKIYIYSKQIIFENGVVSSIQ